MNKVQIRQMVMAALCLALGLVIPTIFHKVGLGRHLLPMHLPVLLAGLWLGSTYGLIVGILCPLLSSLLTSMPPMHMALVMAVELGAYGFFAGFFVNRFSKDWKGILAALVLSMLIGRLFYGVANWLMILSKGNSYSFKVFLASAFVKSIGGILLQLVVLPPLTVVLRKQFPMEK